MTAERFSKLVVDPRRDLNCDLWKYMSRQNRKPRSVNWPSKPVEKLIEDALGG